MLKPYPPAYIQAIYYGEPSIPIIEQPPSQSSMVVAHKPPKVVQQKTNPPSDYLVWSICGSLCCLWPIGLCAIVASLKVRSAVQTGELERAKLFSYITLGINSLNCAAAITIVFLIISGSIHF